MTIGAIARELNANLVTEHVGIDMTVVNQTNHFAYQAEYTDGGTIMLQYSAAKGIEMIASSKGAASITCMPSN